MATLTNQEIEQLKQQLKEKTEEIRVIYDQLIEAGAMEVPDDYLDGVAGGWGKGGWLPNLPSSPSYYQPTMPIR